MYAIILLLLQMSPQVRDIDTSSPASAEQKPEAAIIYYSKYNIGVMLDMMCTYVYVYIYIYIERERCVL